MANAGPAARRYARCLDQERRSPLHYAALTNDAAESQQRLLAGDDPTLGDELGFTPLHFAAQENALDVAQLLLDSGAHIDAANAHGNTPLFVAVFNSRGDGEMIDLLRKNGADPYARNSHGQTPVGLARLIDNYDVAKFFADVSAD